MATQQAASNHYAVHRGPHPGIIATLYVILFVASLLWLGITTSGKGFPNPYGAVQDAQAALLQYAGVIRISNFLQFGAAIPLGIFTAAITSRLRFLGVNVSGVSIALFGGIAASVFMMVSAICGWVLTQPGIGNHADVMHVLQFFGFATGGIAHVATLGLLMAGVAIPSLLGKYTAKWVAILSLVLAAVAELSTFSMLWYPATFLLPIARFGSFVWLIATGFTVVKSKA